jgi:oxygen-independent coproporphyrinogen-3 oxidase
VPVSLAEQADEMLLMGLRLSEGIDLDRIAAASGQSPRAPVLAALEHDGLIERIAKHDVSPGQSSWPDEIKACVGPGMRPAVHVEPPFGHVRATKQGRFVLNEIVLRISASFIPVTVAPASAASR